MTLYEMRLVTVAAIVAIGMIAILASLAALHLPGLARRLKGAVVRPRALPSLRGDARAAARLVDHRQAAWRLRC